jgi:glycosyltransferase involved in cell wall biosynthesis
MVRNEGDIIGTTIDHLLAQGVAGIVVVDNGSNDDTLAVLRDRASRDPRVHVGTDSLSDFYQGEKLSYLAHLARRGGASWVIPFDADEHWFAPEGTLAQWLPTVPEPVAECAIRDAGPLPGQTEIDPHRYLLDALPTPWWKIAFRSRSWVWIGAGNHTCSLTGPRAKGLELHHFQYRSFAQFERKTTQGAEAVLATPGLPDDEANHWKRIASMSHDERWAEWVAICERPDMVVVER